jgi:hypothetical protein
MPGLTRQTTNTSVDSTATDASLKLMSVPLHLVYYILEFMVIVYLILHIYYTLVYLLTLSLSLSICLCYATLPRTGIGFQIKTVMLIIQMRKRPMSEIQREVLRQG